MMPPQRVPIADRVVIVGSARDPAESAQWLEMGLALACAVRFQGLTRGQP